MGIEPTFEAWEAPVLPLNYTRDKSCTTAIPIMVMGRFRTSLYSTLRAIVAHFMCSDVQNCSLTILSNPRLKLGKLQFYH